MVIDQELVSMIGRLLWALVLGGVVGWERERHDRPAGLRTNMLVCMGAALITMGGVQLAGPVHDPGRVAAQIISGIGFLGAGTILRQGNVVRGLTTAASLWVVAGIGMAVGVGGRVAIVASAATVLAYATLRLVALLERRLVARRHVHRLFVHLHGEEEAVAGIVSAVASLGFEVRGVGPLERRPDGPAMLTLRIAVGPGQSEDPLVQSLRERPEVAEAYWE